MNFRFYLKRAAKIRTFSLPANFFEIFLSLFYKNCGQNAQSADLKHFTHKGVF
jgi:hypothetical protein